MKDHNNNYTALLVKLQSYENHKINVKDSVLDPH